MAIPPVKISTNIELNNSTGADKTVKVHTETSAAPASPNQNSEAFQQVNLQLGKNSQSSSNQNHQNAHGNSEGNHPHGNSAHASLQGNVRVSERGNGNHHGHQNHGRTSSDAPRTNENQSSHRGNQGNGHAYGHNKGDGNYNSPKPLNININFSTGNQTGNHQTTGRGHGNHSAPPAPQQQSTNLNLNLNLSLNHSNNGNHNGIVRSVLNQVLRQNDIYLNQNTIKTLVNDTFSRTGNANPNTFARQNISIPPAITQIVQTIRNQVVSVLNNPAVNINTGNIRVTIQNSPELLSLLQTSKHVLMQNFGAKPFVNLNLQARMHIAVELMLHNLPTSQQQILRNQSAKQIFNGLLLACGFAASADKFFSFRDIFAAKKFPLPYNVPPVVIRNLGYAVKSLMVEARLAETPKDLEAAVQKFVRNLSGKDNLDALMSAVKLAEQLGFKGNVEGENSLPEEIANLVKYLLLAGDKALQSVADAFDAAEGEMLLPKNAGNSVNAAETLEMERNFGTIWSGDGADAESALRNKLEINPFFLNDRAASAFENPSEAARAQEEFTNRFHNEIEQWLQSGNHRFVKDLELEKPIGIVVERGTSGYFTADRARMVLVRDGSVQGWHFLKSFLVK